MTTPTVQIEGTGVEPLVKAELIAKALGVTPRYVGMLAEQNRIPVFRFGKRCIRYRISDVLAALGSGGEPSPQS